jgi:hypothetical protein
MRSLTIKHSYHLQKGNCKFNTCMQPFFMEASHSNCDYCLQLFNLSRSITFDNKLPVVS